MVLEHDKFQNKTTRASSTERKEEGHQEQDGYDLKGSGRKNIWGVRSARVMEGLGAEIEYEEVWMSSTNDEDRPDRCQWISARQSAGTTESPAGGASEGKQ